MPVQTTAYPTGTIGFLAFPDQFHFLKTELINRFNFSEKKILNAERYNDLIIFLPEQLPEKIRQDNFIHIIPYWARAVLTELFTAKFESISEAASLLKQIRRNWTPYTTTLFRRTALIQEKLPYINFSPRRFPTPIPKDTTGIYSLLDNTHLIAAPETTAVFPSGILEFQEDHENPPSRAYLKLQEALTYTRMFFNRMPEPGNRCFDAGACPGGWTWVLSRLGCSVFAVDRAELSPELMTHPSVTFLVQILSAFLRFQRKTERARCHSLFHNGFSRIPVCRPHKPFPAIHLCCLLRRTPQRVGQSPDSR